MLFLQPLYSYMIWTRFVYSGRCELSFDSLRPHGIKFGSWDSFLLCKAIHFSSLVTFKEMGIPGVILLVKFILSLNPFKDSLGHGLHVCWVFNALRVFICVSDTESSIYFTWLIPDPINRTSVSLFYLIWFYLMRALLSRYSCRWSFPWTCCLWWIWLIVSL